MYVYMYICIYVYMYISLCIYVYMYNNTISIVIPTIIILIIYRDYYKISLTK